MERDGSDLETEADDEPEQGDHHDRLVGETRSGFGQTGEGDLTGQPEQQRHPVEQDRGGEDPEDEVLHRGLVRLGIALSPSRQEIERAGGELEPDEENDQVPGRGHHERSENRGEEEEVVLALVVALGLDVVVGHEKDDVGRDDEQTLEDHGELVDHI